ALARSDAERYGRLYQEGAISRQQLDQAETNLQAAEAKRQEQAEAWRRAETGTPAEEMEQARESYHQAKAALDLLLAGSRSGEIEGARAAVTEAQQALKLLQRGSRQEEIRAAEARIAQARATLAELRAGSRREQIAQARAAAEEAQRTAKSSGANLAE